MKWQTVSSWWISWGCIALLLPGLSKLLGPSEKHWQSNLSNLDGNKEIQSQSRSVRSFYILFNLFLWYHSVDMKRLALWYENFLGWTSVRSQANLHFDKENVEQRQKLLNDQYKDLDQQAQVIETFWCSDHWFVVFILQNSFVMSKRTPRLRLFACEMVCYMRVCHQEIILQFGTCIVA